jgi:hypothetical protein
MVADRACIAVGSLFKYVALANSTTDGAPVTVENRLITT